MSASGINFSGLGSGIDTESIIQKLIQIEQRPNALMQAQRQRLQQRQTALNTVSAQLIGVQLAATNLNRLRSFDIVTANSSNTDNVDVAAQTGAQIGRYDLNVTNLAQSQMLSSSAQSSQTSPLGYNGQIVINGKAVKVEASDSLQTLASNINSAQTGVTASIISPSANEFYLTLGSNNTGLQGRISLSDTAGGTFLANTLGLFDSSGATSLRNAIGTTGAGSGLFKDSGTSVGTLLGLTSPASGTVQIGGGSVTIDLAQDSLSAIAGKINAANISGVTASVVQATDPLTNESRQQLQISGTQSLTDDNNVLANLGVVQRNLGTGRELTAARDATFTINGLAATRATNVVTDAISGVTLTLKKTGTSTVNISADTATIRSNIKALVQAFNDAQDTISAYSQYDPDSGATGALFGDAIAQATADSLTQIITGQVNGLASGNSLLAQIGVNLGPTGRLTVDDARLDAALAGNLGELARLFRADGTASDSNVQFVNSTDKTQVSGSAGYEVVVTRAATQATYTATNAMTGTLAEDETLTFGGTLFGTSGEGELVGGKTITLRAGSSVNDIVSVINADSTIGKVISASVDSNGKLQLTSKTYGSNAKFAVKSGVADPGNGRSTGIGTTVQTAEGVDVAGTINGEEAKGVGQFLTGSRESSAVQAAGKALGLQLRVTATTAGTYGKIVFTSGIADQVRNFVTQQTDGFSGALTAATRTIQTEMDDIEKSQTDLAERIKNTEQNLRLRFTLMESSIIRIRSASSGLAQLASLQTTRQS